jgi:DNA-binding transcriptional LysR family regulator
VFIYNRVLLAPLRHALLDIPLIAFKDIAACLALYEPSQQNTGSPKGRFSKGGLRYQVVAELDSLDTIKRYVAKGMGISIRPRVAVDPGGEKPGYC